MEQKIKSFFSSPHNILLSCIVLLAASLRLYKISDYMTFLGDEGRDVLIVKHILEGNFTLLGPRSSAADFFYGPIYYYLITPFLWLFKLDPVGPAVFIAIIGILTVYLVYIVGKEWIGIRGGLIAAALYAISPVVLVYSRSSWNPNPLPFVSLFALYLLYKGIEKNKKRYFLFTGILLGLGIQMQYLALFLGAIVAISLGITIFLNKENLLFESIKKYGVIFCGFIIGWSPFLVFEILHRFPNLQTMTNFLLGKYGSPTPTTTTFFGQMHEIFLKLFGRLVTRFPDIHPNQAVEKDYLIVWYVLTIILGIASVICISKIKNKTAKIILFTWVIAGVAFFGFYKKSLYDYYLGFMFPLPFLLVGNLFQNFIKKRSLLTYFALAMLVFLFVFNLLGLPFRSQPNKQKDQVKQIAQFVISKTDNKPFNFALITPGNSDHGYRYYMEVLGHKPVEIQNQFTDPDRKSVTDQLLVVCEDTTCGPLGHSLFEVAAFGRGEIVGEWDTSVVKVFRLIHYVDPNVAKKNTD
ncbi:MAG: glycosyltransferase family 39 protein [Candidatus Levybacteria bacterium]|nr:glycosyltransferase family 39 protein [Candidatus Levybacteria bacterium]